MGYEQYKPFQAYLGHCAAQLPLQADLMFKSMFGGVCVYTKGKPFATLAGEFLALKLPEDVRPELLEIGKQQADCSPEAPAGRQYITLPRALVEDEAKLLPWLEQSIRYVQTLPPPRRRQKQQT